MEIWVALIGGVIIGWLAEWLIDWTYWRRGAEAFYATEAELRRQVESLAAENESLRQQLSARPADRPKDRSTERQSSDARNG